MIKKLKSKALIVSEDTSLKDLLNAMGNRDDALYGIAVVVDNSNKLSGVINNGDIIRYIANNDVLDIPVVSIMTTNPISANIEDSNEVILRKMRNGMINKSKGKKDKTRYLPILNQDNVVLDVVDCYSLTESAIKKFDKVTVIGQGFVGLTLATALANIGHEVTGIDSDSSLVKKLNMANPHIHEPKLIGMMKQSISNGNLKFTNTINDDSNRIYVIAVGTPVDETTKKVNLTALKEASISVGRKIKLGDLILLRSTVPVGTTNNVVKPILESESGLKLSHDFSLAFSPERTAEGKAMDELFSLPQIIGANDSNSFHKANAFWKTLTSNIVEVESFEAGEFVKLLNNSFRDLSFSFANEFALKANYYNLNAFEIIKAANEGYIRNPIPKPSPGVGGYCLTKDPFLYSIDTSQTVIKGECTSLSEYGRLINQFAGKYPIKSLVEYCKRLNRKLNELNIFIIGVAFKGLPETNDTRGSVSIDIYNQLASMGCLVSCYDSVINEDELTSAGLSFKNVERGVTEADAVLILNDHPENITNNFFELLRKKEQLMIFDGWNLLDKYQVEQYSGLIYSTMGYMTK